MAQDNETMHVVVLSQIVQRLRLPKLHSSYVHPFLFSFFYFWTVYILFLVSRRRHSTSITSLSRCAYEQYSQFLENEGETPETDSRHLRLPCILWKNVRNEYELFELIRNDELIHRNHSAHASQLGYGLHSH